jgi:hypothetical protein
VQRPFDWILEGSIGFVDPCRGLQREPTLRLASGREAIRMHFALQLAVRGVELARIAVIPRRQPEQRKVVLGEIDHDMPWRGERGE